MIAMWYLMPWEEIWVSTTRQGADSFSQESDINYHIHLRLYNQSLIVVFLTTHMYMPCDKKALHSGSVSECWMLANVSVITETMKITSHTIDTNTSDTLETIGRASDYTPKWENMSSRYVVCKTWVSQLRYINVLVIQNLGVKWQ